MTLTELANRPIQFGPPAAALALAVLDATTTYREQRQEPVPFIELGLDDSQAIADHAWASLPLDVRPRQKPILKVGDTAQLWGIELNITNLPSGTANIGGMTVTLRPKPVPQHGVPAATGHLIGDVVEPPIGPNPLAIPSHPDAFPEHKTNAQIRRERFVGTPPTSNITSHQLAKMLLLHPEAPVLVLFDNEAGCASEISVFTKVTDPPDWADPSTIYIVADGG